MPMRHALYPVVRRRSQRTPQGSAHGKPEIQNKEESRTQKPTYTPSFWLPLTLHCSESVLQYRRSSREVPSMLETCTGKGEHLLDYNTVLEGEMVGQQFPARAQLKRVAHGHC
ncbi:G-protein coupled receptor 61 isoform X2 [Tiliqua scincoides]|uniref:G-protein coupled receptor 61 isoform X2 n=1 Tax=Tiliqua scincoides TaxID=71010 RepID=UPI0034629450